MKKLFAMMMAMMMAFSMAACGGEETVEEPETSLVMQEAGMVSMLVPDDFEAFAQYEGMIAAPGPGSSIIVADPWVADVAAADITEADVAEMVSGSYPDAVVLEYENPVEIGGTEAVTFTIEGTHEDGGKNTVTYALLFYMMDDVMYEQDLCFTYRTGEGTSLEAAMPEIIDSITIG